MEQPRSAYSICAMLQFRMRTPAWEGMLQAVARTNLISRAQIRMAIDSVLRASIQNLLEGVQIIGFDWTYLYLNEAAERHARRQAAELVGRRMMECYPGIEQTPMFEALRRVMQGRKPEPYLSEFVYPDGSRGWFELLIEPVVDGVCVVSLEIGDTQQLQGAPLQTRSIDLNRVVIDVHSMLTRLIGDRIHLVVDTAADLRHALADPGLVEQVLMTLVVNARDAVAEGGTVRISTANVTLDEAFVRAHPGAAAGEYVALAVEDTGEGIPSETLPHVFEPFFTTKGPGKGTGLGLPTVRGIVQQSGGYIGIDTAVGIGTTVTSYLPATDAPLPGAASGGVPRPVSGTETVLLVQDDEQEREMTRRVLEAQGYTVLDALDVWDALTIARSRSTRIDLLVTDILMPEMNGPQLTTHVRSMHPHIRVLYVSEFAEAGAFGSAIASARASFLPKPFMAGALLASVRDALDGRN